MENICSPSWFYNIISYLFNLIDTPSIDLDDDDNDIPPEMIWEAMSDL